MYSLVITNIITERHGPCMTNFFQFFVHSAFRKTPVVNKLVRYFQPLILVLWMIQGTFSNKHITFILLNKCYVLLFPQLLDSYDNLLLFLPCAPLVARYFTATQSLGKIDSLISVSCFQVFGAALRFSEIITLF